MNDTTTNKENTMSTTKKASSRGKNDGRGSSTDRHNRKVNLARHNDPELGDDRCYCVYCGTVAYVVSRSAIAEWQAWMAETHGPRAAAGMYPAECLTADRIEPYGSYKMQNLVPAHGPCNGDASDTTWADRWAHDPTRGQLLADHAAAYRPRPRSRK